MATAREGSGRSLIPLRAGGAALPSAHGEGLKTIDPPLGAVAPSRLGQCPVEITPPARRGSGARRLGEKELSARERGGATPSRSASFIELLELLPPETPRASLPLDVVPSRRGGPTCGASLRRSKKASTPLPAPAAPIGCPYRRRGARRWRCRTRPRGGRSAPRAGGGGGLPQRRTARAAWSSRGARLGDPLRASEVERASLENSPGSWRSGLGVAPCFVAPAPHGTGNLLSRQARSRMTGFRKIRCSGSRTCALVGRQPSMSGTRHINDKDEAHARLDVVGLLAVRSERRCACSSLLRPVRRGLGRIWLRDSAARGASFSSPRRSNLSAPDSVWVMCSRQGRLRGGSTTMGCEP